MNYLIDTHILLWYFNDQKKISPYLKEILFNENNNIYISTASLWEISIKISKGNLNINCSIDDFIKKIKDHELSILDIASSHFRELIKLPFHHKDPFDRLIVSQALAEDFILISNDRKFDYYDIKMVK